MSLQYAFLFPGQGAQYVGMGQDFYETFAEAREIFQEADEVLKESLSKLIFQGTPSQLSLTRNSQVAIFTVSIALLCVLQKQLPEVLPSVCSGLSLGEYSACVAAEKISFREALLLVQKRALAMQEACERHIGTMRVVLGVEPDVIEKQIVSLGLQSSVWVANINCPGQVVISGTLEGIELVSQALKNCGARRILPLEVSGAFHSGLMQHAQDFLLDPIQSTNFQDSPLSLVMNTPGDYVETLADIKKNLILQVTHTVFWERGIRTIAKRGVQKFIEIGCGKTLSGMNRKIGIPDEAIFNLEKVSDIEILAGALCNC